MSENQKSENKQADKEGSSKELQSFENSPVKVQSQIEEMILTKFQGEDLQSRIQNTLRGIITNELSKMSGLLRGSIRDWIDQEKLKSQNELQEHKGTVVDEKLLEFDQQKKELDSEIKALKRKIELKDQENTLIFQSLQQLMGSQNKK